MRSLCREWETALPSASRRNEVSTLSSAKGIVRIDFTSSSVRSSAIARDLLNCWGEQGGQNLSKVDLITKNSRSRSIQNKQFLALAYCDRGRGSISLT